MRGHRSSAPAGGIWRRMLSPPAAVGAVIALAAGAGGGAHAAPHAPAAGAAAIMPAPAPGAVPAAAARAGTWRLLPKAPVTRAPDQISAVWTGREMIVHGVYFHKAGGIRGVTFAYRPAARTWARLADGPSSPSAFETTDVAVWTGSLMLVPGQTSAIYDPAANAWRQMPRGGGSLYGAVTGWTGHLFLEWGGTCCEENSRDGAAYDPASNTWSVLPAAPLAARRGASGAWTGRELVVAGGHRLPLSGRGKYFRDAAAYNPAAGTWRTIAPMPRRQAGATAVWDGKEVLFIGGGGRSGLYRRPLAYNPAANRWRLLPPMAYPRTGFAAVWAGRRLLVWGGLTAARVPPPHGEAYTPATNKWAALPQAPLRGRAGPVAVRAGRRMIIWGGSGRTDGATYTPAPAPVAWGKAITVPGLAALQQGRFAEVSSVSCPSAGNCAAGGFYEPFVNYQHGFVVSERHGRWGKATQLAGLSALGQNAVTSVSCASVGNCTVGGGSGFVAEERHGVWSKAIHVPGLAALGGGDVTSVSCSSAGNCAAGGTYGDHAGNSQGFVADERDGVWGTAIQVPGLAALNTGGLADVMSVSCGSAGDCAVGGDYGNGQGGFVAVERGGVWGSAIEMPGPALNAGGEALVDSVSCPSAGNCLAGGYYADSADSWHGFVVVERGGVWGSAIEVPGLAALNTGGLADVMSVSCGSAGNCAAGGDYTDSRLRQQGFVAVERDGAWSKAIQMPGPALNSAGYADVYSVSCAPAGGCAAGGFYEGHYLEQGFVVVERHGAWGKAIQVPGLGALSAGGFAWVNSVSCASAGCAAGGRYQHDNGKRLGFVTQAR